jgi:hypothetical protein
VLNLAIGPRVSQSNVLDFNGTAFTEILELIRVEIGSQVRDDSVGETKMVQDIIDKTNHSIRRKRYDWLLLDPLGKLVDDHQHVSKTTRRSGQGPYLVQALACK